MGRGFGVSGGSFEQLRSAMVEEMNRCGECGEKGIHSAECSRSLIPKAGRPAPPPLRNLAGVMMQHHAQARWWQVRLKARTYLAARRYARRSLGWPR